MTDWPFERQNAHDLERNVLQANSGADGILVTEYLPHHGVPN